MISMKYWKSFLCCIALLAMAATILSSDYLFGPAIVMDWGHLLCGLSGLIFLLLV